jgi:hypothetical protein
VTRHRLPALCLFVQQLGRRVSVLSAAATVMLLLTSTTASARGGRAADPVLVSLSPAPGAQLAPGSTFSERFAEKNIGHGRAVASIVGFYLSPSLTLGHGAGHPAIEAPVSALKPGRVVRSSATIRVADTVSAGSYFLIACTYVRHHHRGHRQRRDCRAATGQVTVVRNGPTSGGKSGNGSSGGGATGPPRGEPAPSPGVTELAPVLYTAIDGHTETLTPWQGQHVTVLVEPGVTRNPAVMTKLVEALDRAWEYYATTTGRLPATAHSLNGRDEIAEVTSTCGAGCTYIGATGTEILTSYFETMYNEIAEGELYDQIPFYELGRSFWFYSPQLQFQPPDQDPVVTGFAVWMRFRAMAAAHVNGAPFNGTPFTTFASQVQGLAAEYEANPSLTFAETLAQDKSPGMYGGTDFWASLMMHLAQRHGEQTFVERFFHHAAELPSAASTTEAVTNWVNDASYAACTDLGPVFYERWGFPRPDGTVTPRPAASTIPEPEGHC